MKTFFGGTFIDIFKLKEAKLYNPIKVEYYKIQNEEQEKRRYGIEIVKKEFTKKNILVENKIIEEVTNDEKIINKILGLLKANEVTPVTANDIIQDLIY